MKFLQERDIFGQPVTVLYKGSDVYKTKMGALCSLLVTILILVNVAILTEGFMDGSKQ